MPAVGVRIGLACLRDPTQRAIFSGMPASLMAALQETVDEAIPLGADVPRHAERLAILAGVAARSSAQDLLSPRAALAAHRDAAVWGRVLVTLGSAALRLRLARAGPLDGCVLLHPEFSLPASVRTVTFQDSTVVQAARSYPWPYLNGWSERDRELATRRHRAAYLRAIACTAASHWAARSIVEDYGIDPTKVHVVGLGPNQPFRPAPTRDWSVPRYLFVGVEWTRKNGDAVLGAFAQVRREHPQATLELVGAHPPVELDGVTGHGRLSLGDDDDQARLATLYDRATVLVVPSLHEPLGAVYLEAGQAGIPSIGSANGGAETVIGPGGYVVPPDDRRALVEAMRRLAYPAHAAEMGAHASEHARLFTWRRVAERLIRALAPPGIDCSRLAEFL